MNEHLSRRDQFLLSAMQAKFRHHGHLSAVITVNEVDEYLAVAARTAKPEPVKSGDGWRDPDKVKPPLDTPVLVYCESEKWYVVAKMDSDVMRWVDRSYAITPRVTHWQPITGPETGGEGK